MIIRNYQLLKATHFQALYVLMISVFVFFTNTTSAQSFQNSADTSKIKDIELFVATSDSIAQIEALITEFFDQKKDTLTGLNLCTSFLERGKKEENYEIQYFASFQLAYIYYVKSDHNKAIQYGNLAVKAASNLQDSVKGISSNSLLGSALYVTGNYDEALKSYLAAKKLSNQIENSPYDILCITNIANTRLKLYQFKDALENFNTILSILKETDSTTFSQYNQTLMSATLSKGLSLFELDRLEEAETVYSNGIKYSTKVKDKKYEAFFNINLGHLHYKKKKYLKSLGFLMEGKKMLRDFSELENNKFIANYFIALNYFELKRYEEALTLLDENFERIGNRTNTDKAEEMYELAADISKIQEDFEKQAFYIEKAKEVSNAKSEKKLLGRELLHKDDIKDITIENEKLTNEKAKTQMDKSIILTVAIILVAVLLFTFLSYHRKTKQKEQRFLAIIDDISKKEVAETKQKVSQVSQIKDEKAKAILEKLHELETTAFYLSQDVTLHKTAKLLNTNTTYLSKALNAIEKQSFSQYLNKLRINYVLVKLKEDAVFRSYTIHAISTEIGYKSATTFIKEFKNRTGLNPSYYIKKIED